MHKILTGALLLIASVASAQVDTTDNFDYSKFGEADGVKRYCTQKVLNQTPQKIISIGFDQYGSLESLAATGSCIMGLFSIYV